MPKCFFFCFSFCCFCFNRLQYQTLRDAGKNVDNIPLVDVRDIMTYMPQLLYMVQNQEQPTSKRARIS